MRCARRHTRPQVELPLLEHPAGVYELLRLAGATPTPGAALDTHLDEMVEAVPAGATLKQVLRALELSRRPAEADEEVEEEEAAADQRLEATSADAGAEASPSTAATVTAAGEAVAAASTGDGEEANEAAAAATGETQAGGGAGSEDEDEDEAEFVAGPVAEPLTHTPVDVARFRELLALSPWTLHVKQHGGPGVEPVAHVHVVGQNESMPDSAVRWAGVPSNDAEEEF